MIESTQATQGGIKENSQSSKAPKQSWGHEEKSKGSKNFEQKKKNQYDDAQNQMKKTKTKRKSLSLTLAGTIDHIRKTFK
jgi:hypothetical protein